MDPRAEFAAVLREIGAVVEGEHPIMNGEAQRIPAVNDKRCELTIFYVVHDDGVPIRERMGKNAASALPVAVAAERTRE